MSPKLRTKDKHLPPRVYRKHGRYYFVDKNNKWHNLGKTPTEMAIEWAKLFEVSDCNYRTMNEVFDRYMAEVLPTKAEATQKGNHKEMMFLRAFFGNMQPEEVTSVDVYRYQDLRGKTAPIRANREKSLLSHAFSMAIKWGVVRFNPCKEVKRLREVPRDRLITGNEFYAVRNIASPLLRNLMDFAYATSLRRTDILNIKWSDITEDGILVPISKTQKRTNKKMLYKLDPYSRELISRIPKRGFYLFSNKIGKKYTDSGINTMWYRLIQKALGDGLIKESFQFRDIRAESATDEKAERGMEAARERLGHTSLAMTGTYIRSVTELNMRKLPSNK